MNVLGINHIGLASTDPQKTKWFLRDVLHLPFEGEELVLSQKTNTIMFGSTSKGPASLSRVEILENQPGEDGPIAKYLEKKGGGIHHLAVSVDSIDGALATMRAHNVQMIDETPRDGAHHTRIAFVHPKATGGILVELVEQTGAQSL